MKTLRIIPPILLWLALPAVASKHTPPPVQPATAFAAVETHADEKVSIAAEPYDTREKEAIFRIDYLGHGVMPIRLIITNNGSRPISLSDARIIFLTAAGDRIQAAEPEDVERLMTRKEREGGKIPSHQAQAQGRQQGDRAGLQHLRVQLAGRRAAHHARRLSLLRRLRHRPPTPGRQPAPAQAARRRRQRAFLL
jgi:hypothetical protein